MTIRTVIVDGDPKLRTPSIDVDLDKNDWEEDASDLLQTLLHLKVQHGFGRALAGPQIGSPYRLIAFDCAIGRFVAINPVMTWASPEQQKVLDDCFSFPGRKIEVMRWLSVSFKCCDARRKSLSFEGLPPDLSELVQHEMDHLDGILMVDRQPPFATT